MGSRYTMGPLGWKLKTSLVSVATEQPLQLKLLGCWLSGLRLLPRHQSSYIPAEEANISARGATPRLTATHLSSGLKVVGGSEVSLAKSFDFVLERIITGYTTG